MVEWSRRRQRYERSHHRPQRRQPRGVAHAVDGAGGGGRLLRRDQRVQRAIVRCRPERSAQRHRVAAQTRPHRTNKGLRRGAAPRQGLDELAQVLVAEKRRVGDADDEPAAREQRRRREHRLVTSVEAVKSATHTDVATSAEPFSVAERRARVVGGCRVIVRKQPFGQRVARQPCQSETSPCGIHAVSQMAWAGTRGDIRIDLHGVAHGCDTVGGGEQHAHVEPWPPCAGHFIDHPHTLLGVAERDGIPVAIEQHIQAAMHKPGRG